MAPDEEHRAVASTPRPPPPPPPGDAGGWPARLVGALPALAFLATFGVFFVDKNRAARSVLGSGRGLLAVAALVGGYVVVAVVVRTVARRRWVAPVVLTAVVLGLAAWIVRPYYVDETAERRLVAGPVQDASGTTTTAGPGSGPTTAPTAPPTTAAPAGARPAPEPSVRTAPTTAPAPPPAAAPVRISSGALRGIGHDATGTASIIRNPDGSLVVRFERFEIEGTPDPRVHLVRGSDARRPGDGVELGRLEGNRGEVLDYAVPAGTGAGPGWTVLVWCRAFSVPVANATQAAT